MVVRIVLVQGLIIIYEIEIQNKPLLHRITLSIYGPISLFTGQMKTSEMVEKRGGMNS